MVETNVASDYVCNGNGDDEADSIMSVTPVTEVVVVIIVVVANIGLTAVEVVAASVGEAAV